MKKKSVIIALLLASVMAISGVAGCKKKHGPDDNTNPDTSQTDTTNPGDDEQKPGGDEQKPGGNDEGDKKPGGNDEGDKKPGGDTGDEEEDQPVVLSEDTAVSITAGDMKQLSAPAGATYESQNSSVATVDSTGKITAVSSGVTVVKVTSGNSVINCTVIVMKKLQGTTEAPAKDPFTFANGSKDIGSVEVTAPSAPVDTNAEEYKVTFSDAEAQAQFVAKNAYAVEPTDVSKDGYYLSGWKNGNAVYDFNTPVTSNVTLTAQWKALPSGIDLVSGNFESIAVEFTGANTTTVQYKLGDGDWKNVDGELVRSIGGGQSRVDILGLKAGVYSVKVGSTEITEIPVKAYDRSGYAHFNYTQGIGAYNDDGTLKDGALIIYVTNDNKNDVTNSVYKYNAAADTYTKENISSYINYTQLDGQTVSASTAKGIGEILNNRRYSGNDRANCGIARLSKEYGAVAIRIVGEVFSDMPDGVHSSIIGLTDYNATTNGGTAGDNGGMARMVNARNVTIEGVGYDATVRGWGFHFVASSTSARPDNKGVYETEYGKGFEARNITFAGYPEDALGMEGEQASKKDTSDLLASVERCWIHNNTFLQGGNGNAAESDKGEGDGSCDFKRGQYYTFSYNYLENCHKTNLIGSADYSLQYNISMHHNYWYNCWARMPLVRNSNVHFYNNFVSCDVTVANKPKLSYVMSARANSYVLCEGNYFNGCKQITRKETESGRIKAYNNQQTSCYEHQGGIVYVDSRTDTVANNCKFAAKNINYSSFDTNKNQFYYDDVEKKSDCLLDSPVMARTRAVIQSGVLHGDTAKPDTVNKNSGTPSAAINAAGGKLTIDISKAASGKEVSNVLFGGTMSSSGKGKGQLITFTLSATTSVTVTADSVKDDDWKPQLVRSDGKIMIDKFTGTVSVELGAGTYIIESGMKDKESTITALSFEEGAGASESRVNAAKEALAAIPQIVTRNSGSVITAAGTAYASLSSSEKEQVEASLYNRYLAAKQAYDEICVNYAIARINYIGTVTEYSGKDITEATKAYNALDAAAKAKVTNASTLSAAQTTFTAFASQNVKNQIETLPLSAADVTAIKASKPAIELMLEILQEIQDDYVDLDEDVKSGVDNIAKVNTAITDLSGKLDDIKAEEAEAATFESFKAELAKVNKDAVTSDQAKAVMALYNKLSDAHKAEYASNETFVAVKAKYTSDASQAVTVTFIGGKPSSNVFVSTGSKQSKKDTKLTVHAYSETEQLASGLKFESTTKLELTLEATMVVKFYTFSTAGLKIDGTNKASQSVGGDNVITVTLNAGTHTIERGAKEDALYFVEINPA